VPAPHQVPPLVLLEALAAGLPVVSADAPAIRELAPSDAAGMFITPGEIQSLATAICNHFEHAGPGILRASGIRQRMQAEPTPADEAAAYVELFQRLLAVKR